MQTVRGFLNERVRLLGFHIHPFSFSLSPNYPPCFCREDKESLCYRWPPLPTPRSHIEEHKCPAPSTRWSVSSGRRNSSTSNYITLEFGFSKTWRLEGRGLLVGRYCWPLNVHKRAPGLLTAAPPAPKHRLAKGGGGLLGEPGGGVQISLWSLSKRGERMEYEGTKNWGGESEGCEDEAGRGCSGCRLGVIGRRCPWSLNTRTRPEGEHPEGVKGAGSSATANGGALRRGKRAAKSLRSDRPFGMLE